MVLLADVSLGLVAYNTVPSGGLLQLHALPSRLACSCCKRLGFGNTRICETKDNRILAIAATGLPPPPTASSTFSIPACTLSSS